MSKEKNRKIYILLTRLPDNASKAISVLTKSYYTHASIGLEGDMNTFYSFVAKGGFRVEQITRYIKPNREPFPCELYEMNVTEKTYNKIKELIDDFIVNKNLYSYAMLGAVMAVLRIPCVVKQRYYCAQFVAEILEESNAAQLTKSSALYYPSDLSKLPNKKKIFHGNLQAFLNKFVNETATV